LARARVVEQSTNPTGKKLVWEIRTDISTRASNGGVLTERGADIILIDDPLKPEEALSDVFRRLKSTVERGPRPPSRRRAFYADPRKTI